VLEKIDLKQSLKKDAYNEKMSYFETRLGELRVQSLFGFQNGG